MERPPNLEPVGSPHDSASLEQNVVSTAKSLDQWFQTSAGREPSEGLSRMQEGMQKARLRLVGKIARIATAGALMFVCGTEVLRQATRYEITEQKTESGPVYTHEDELTTAILDWISGKGELPESECRIIFKDFVRRVHEVNSLPVPEDLDQMDIGSLKATLAEVYSGWGEMSDADVVRSAEFSYHTEIDSYVYNDDLYNALWELERDSGAPRIRFSSDNAVIRPVVQSDKEAWYNSTNNTVYIPNHSYALDDLVAELAHSVQFDREPVTTYLNGASDVVSTILRSAVTGMSLDESFQQNYARPGTVEHEAHRIIEPVLKGRLGGVEQQKKPNPVSKKTGKIGR